MDSIVNPVKPKVVVISGCESLIGRAVEYLIADEKECVILRTFEGQDLADLVSKVEKANPNIIIISQYERDTDRKFLAQLMLVCPELEKVILVILSGNLMEVYRKQRIQVNSVQDLFSEVESQFSL